jgi:polysaccharide export outer membrane protein
VQDIQAAGLHPGQLKQRLEERFKEWVDVPNVTVIVDTIQSYEIYVMGNVANPGIVRSATPLTILQALGTAGGFREFAKKNGVTIIRGKDRMRFNFDEFIDGRAPNENITLLSGDVVWVP